MTFLKSNLELRNSLKDDYLNMLISTAKTEIVREGYTFSDSENMTDSEGNLVVMYAAYLYRKRTGNSEGYSTAALNPQGMPYMLRYALNNAVFSQKMGANS